VVHGAPASSPPRWSAEFAGVRVVMIHSDVEGGPAETDARKLRDLLGKLGADVLICGNAHDAFEARLDDELVVSPGAGLVLGGLTTDQGRSPPTRPRSAA
jgi:predicted phosphodiesterase